MQMRATKQVWAIAVGAVLFVFAGAVGYYAGMKYVQVHARAGAGANRLSAIPDDEASFLVDNCREWERDKSLGLVYRCNAMAAKEIVKRRTIVSSGPLMVGAWVVAQGTARAFKYSALLPGASPAALILMFPDGNGGLVRYVAVEASPEDLSRATKSVTSGPYLPFVPTERGQFVALGRLDPDGVTNVDAGAFKDQGQKLVRIPEGNVAVGLRLSDGTYTNFVPLEKLAGSTDPAPTPTRPSEE
jgi:hypothetical protein